MFSVAPMRRLRALVLERDAHSVLQDWGELGAVELTRTLPGPESAPLPPRDRSTELARGERLRARIAELRRSLEIPPVGEDGFRSGGAPWHRRPGRTQRGPTRFARLPAAGASVPPMTLDQAEERLREMEARADEWLKRRRQLVERCATLDATCAQLSSVRDVDLPLDGFDRFAFLHFVTGSVPAENWEPLQPRAAESLVLLPLPVQKGRQPLIAMTTHRAWPAAEVLLREAGFEAETLPVAGGRTSSALSEQSQRELTAAADELERVDAAIQGLAAELAAPLRAVERGVETGRRLLEAESLVSRTGTAVLLSGWLPADTVAWLEQRLRQVTSGRYVLDVGAAETRPGEQVPVLFRHPRWLRPFGRLVSAYGLPEYGELEPTLFVALSFVLMFGMMFGDVGHGALLVLAGWWLWRKGGLEPRTNRLEPTTSNSGRNEGLREAGVLMMAGGGASLGFGWAYGSCFGLECFQRFALWQEPINGDPMRLIRGALAVGVVLISLGLILNIINHLRRGDWLGACLDKFGLAGALFYWGALVLILCADFIRSLGLWGVAVLCFVAVPLMGWAVREPLVYRLKRRIGAPLEAGEGWFSAVAESWVGAFEAVLSYLANTISFVRLAAYAMSHAALLAAAFAMAAELRPVPFAGDTLAVLVIVSGNLVALVLEGLIASVQALRLEYYEFFGKFFLGSGRPFRPFRLAAGAEALPG